MANSSFWENTDKVTSGTLQACMEAGHSQISVAHDRSEQWGISCAGTEGRGWGQCAVSDSPTVPAHTSCALRGWQQADVLIQSLQGGLYFFLPLLK